MREDAPRGEGALRPDGDRGLVGWALAGHIEAVLFDFDGTIADSIPHILASFRHATQVVLGEALLDDVLLRNVGIPLAEQMRHLTDDEEVAARLLQAYRRFNHATHDEMVRAFEGAHDVLATLRGHGLATGLVTSKSAPIARRGIELLGLGDLFDVIITADDVERHKPDPLPVLRAAEALRIPSERTAYVGDSPADVQAARSAGAVAIAATWGVASRERLLAVEPDVVIDDLRELVPLLIAPGEGYSDSGRPHDACVDACVEEDQ